MCSPMVFGPSVSTFWICSASPATQALARALALSGVAPRAETLIRTVSVGWLTLTLPINDPADAFSKSGFPASCFRAASAVSVLVAIARYDVTRDLARESYMVALPALSLPLLGLPVTKPEAVA